MSDQLPSHDSLPQSLTEFNPSQDNLDNQDEEENLQDSLSKSGFKRRAIIHQSSDALSDIEKNGATWLPDTSEPLTFKESTQSEFMVSNSPEKGSFSGMGFQPAEYSSLQTLKCIINEAKQAERYMFSGEEHHYEVDNYMKVHFSDENEVREYFLEDDVTFDRMPTSIKKTENQGLVIDFTGESIQKENEELKTSTLTNEALGHSKSSYISGSVRYSKMPEEEAASIFEQRRKELLDSLAKKGKRKNLRIFQDTDQNTARLPTGADNQMSSPKEKSTVPGFVIFNTGKSNASQLRGAESPLSAKKDRQKDSMLRKSLTSARSPKTHTQAAVSMSQSREKKEFTSPREYSSPVSITRENTVKTKPVEKREVQKKEPVSSPIVKTVVKDIKNPKREELSPTKICVDAKILKHTSSSTKNIKNSARDTAMTEEDRKVKRETLSKINESEYDREIKSADIMPKQQIKGKNKEIWADIEELDQQIQQLEESKVSLDKQREQVNSSITFSEQGSRLDNKSMFKRKTKEDITERVPVLYRNERLPSENESPGKGISSDRYKLDSEDFLIETETDNVYKRYLSERSQAESPVINYRKSPNQDESSLNIYSQSYRSQNDRRLSNPGEYLYQRALEKKENRQQQIEKRQKEKEIMELSACTFTPNLRPLDTSEDFETRSRNWQNQKEKRLDEIQKYNMEKEMAECTFYPSTSRKTGPIKSDPNDFYNRNIEWKKKVETEDVEKHNEPVRTTTMSSENKSQSNVSYSSKPSYSNVPSISKAVEPQNANKGYIKLQLGNKKPNETEAVKVFTLTNDTHRSKMKPVEVHSQHLGTLEDEFSYRRRSDQIKRPTLENFVSTELKDILKRGANYKSDKIETTKSKGTSPNKTPKNLQLNTSKSREMQPNHPVILTTLRDSFPSKKSPTSQNGTPLGFTDNFSKSVKNSMEGTQAKGNKYYLSRKPKQIESATVPTHQDTYSSIDKKDPVMSAGYSNQSRKQSSNKVMAPGAYQLIQGSKVDQENKHFKKKPLSKGQTTSYASGELSEDQLFFYPEESRIPLATRQANNNDMANSPHDYIRRNTSKEIANNFEKDFLEFVSMAGKERQPSDKNVSPDGDLSKKRRTNLSLQ